MDKPQPTTLPQPSPNSDPNLLITRPGIIEAFWANHFSVLFGEFLLAAIILTLGARFWLDRELPLPATALISGFMVGGPFVVRTLCGLLTRLSAVVLVQFLVGGLVSVFFYVALRGQLQGAIGRGTFVEFTAVFIACRAVFGVAMGDLRRTSITGGPELLRITTVTAAALWLHQKLLTNGSVGAGDAYWYTMMTADFVTQWREGVFPVFVGQSEFAFNGAINPLRFAPGLQHLAGVVDLFTLRSLSFHGILNLTLVASFVGGALSCYGCLRAINSKAAWLAAVFAFLYSATPGALSLAYAGDLFMSITTLPFIPLALYGAWRTLVKPERYGLALMVAAVAAMWFCHPPIALWATAVVAVTQLFRLFRDGRLARTWGDWAAAAALFCVLSGYSFVSVLSLDIPPYAVPAAAIVENLKANFRISLDPINPDAGSLGDFQLGWALWSVLAATLLACAFSRPKRPAVAFLGSAFFILAFLVPVPGLLEKLWMRLPQAVVDITYTWPPQRLYVILAAILAFAGFLTLGALSIRNRLSGGILFVLSLAAAVWSGREAASFHYRATKFYTDSAAARRSILPQNQVLTRYSYSPRKSYPPYFSHGVVDPEMQNRLLERGTGREIIANSTAYEHPDPSTRSVVSGELTFTQPDPALPTMMITPTVRLEPGKKYALRIEFHHPEFQGALAMRGASLFRIYYLPDSGYGMTPTTPSRAFGALPGQSGLVTLWTDRSTPEEISFIFYFTGPGPTEKIPSFGRYTLYEIHRDTFPIQVTRWSPYRAEISSPVPALLETPRMFLDGYAAKVNRHPVSVVSSPSGLVALAIPAGESRVELTFRGPVFLRVAYFSSLAAWTLLVGLALSRQIINRRS